MGDLGLKFLGISCYLQTTKQVPGETEVFSFFLADSSGMIISASFYVCVGYDDLGIFPTSLGNTCRGICDGTQVLFHHPTERETRGIACNSVSARPYFLLLKKPCFCNEPPPGHISEGPHNSQTLFWCWLSLSTGKNSVCPHPKPHPLA